MKNKFKVTAKAPTVYQTNSLRRFGMAIKEMGNGSFLSEETFDSEEEAKDYLVKRAEMHYDEFEGQVNEHLSTIENNGYLEIDAVTARIEEVEIDVEVNFLEFDDSVASQYGYNECAIYEIK